MCGGCMQLHSTCNPQALMPQRHLSTTATSHVCVRVCVRVPNPETL